MEAFTLNCFGGGSLYSKNYKEKGWVKVHLF